MPGSTWNDDLKAYEASKKNLNFEQPPKPKFISNAEKKAKEREYDPVLQHYRNGDKEDSLKQVESRKQEQATRRAWANTLHREAPYNLINNQAKRKVKTPPKKESKPKPVGKESRVNYNLLTNERLPGRPPSPEKGESNIVREAHREYNILSNHYWTGHDERITKEREAERKTLKERYWKTHDLDVLTQVYHDPKKEAAIKAEEDVRHELNAIRQASGFPPAVALSEGQCFDITSGVVLDPDKHAYREGKANAAARRKAVGPKFEEMNRKRNEQEDDKKLARLIERNSYARFAETEKRGYDVLTNVSYKGLGGKPPVKPRMAEPKTLKDFVADPHNLGTPAIKKKLDVPEPTYEDYYQGEGEGEGGEHDSVGYVDGEPIPAEDIPGPEGSIPPSSRASHRSLAALSRTSSREGSAPPSTADSVRSKSSRASTAHNQRAQTARSAASSHASSRSSRSSQHGPKTVSSRGSSRAQTAASVASSRVSLATPNSADLQRASSKPVRKPATAPSSRASSAAVATRPVSAASGVSQAGSAKSSAALAASALLKSRASSRSSLAASQRSQTALSARIASSRASSRAKSVKA